MPRKGQAEKAAELIKKGHFLFYLWPSIAAGTAGHHLGGGPHLGPGAVGGLLQS